MNHGLLWLLLVTIDDHRTAFAIVGSVMFIACTMGFGIASDAGASAAVKRWLAVGIFYGGLLCGLALWVPEAHRLGEATEHAEQAR